MTAFSMDLGFNLSLGEMTHANTCLVDSVVGKGFSVLMLRVPDCCGYAVLEADHVVFPIRGTGQHARW